MKLSATPFPGLIKTAALSAAIVFCVTPATHADYIKTNGVSIAAGGTFYFGAASETIAVAASHGLIVQAIDGVAHANDLLAVQGYTNLGYNGGDWLGTGLSSHQAAADAQVNGVLGLMRYDNAQLGLSNFQGATNLDTIPDGNLNQTMVRMTYIGDFNADGQINFLDFLALNGYSSANDVFSGDINGDNAVNFLDFLTLNSITQVYGSLGDASAFSGGANVGQVVPEPASGALVAAGAAWLLALRRRKISQ